MSIHSQFAFGPTKMVMPIFKSNQYQFTFNLNLSKSNFQFVSCYRSSGKFDPKNSLYLLICLCFRSNGKFDPKNSLHPPTWCGDNPAASSIQRTVCIYPFVYVSSQTTSSIQRTVCVCLSVCIFNQVSSSIQRTACICLYVYVSGQVPSSIPRTACTYLLFCLPWSSG